MLLEIQSNAWASIRNYIRFNFTKQSQFCETGRELCNHLEERIRECSFHSNRKLSQLHRHKFSKRTGDQREEINTTYKAWESAFLAQWTNMSRSDRDTFVINNKILLRDCLLFVTVASELSGQ